jgi:hypothetical protein
VHGWATITTKCMCGLPRLKATPPLIGEFITQTGEEFGGDIAQAARPHLEDPVAEFEYALGVTRRPMVTPK